MYIPSHFAENRNEVLHRLIRDHPFAALITSGPDGLDANHLPFGFDPAKGEHGTLFAHVARANPLWREVANGSPVLVVFIASQGYISPNWYPSKHESHRQVPTWNYQVVHAHGRITVHDEERFVRGVVAKLTRTHEASQPRPWKMGDSSAEFIDGMLGAIVGIEVEVTRLVGKSKLSQNKEVRDRLGASDGLEAQGNAGLSDAMRQAD